MTRTAPVYTSAVLHFDADPHGRGWVLTLNARDAQAVEPIGDPRQRVPSHFGNQPPAWAIAEARRYARSIGVRLPARGGWSPRGWAAWEAAI